MRMAPLTTPARTRITAQLQRAALPHHSFCTAPTHSPRSQQTRRRGRRWLIALAFFLAEAFINSGLGNRIAYTIVRLFGKTTLGLTYSLVFSEALLAPAIPSVAARGGGIFFPLAKALCLACGSDPENGTEKVMGSYLMKARPPPSLYPYP